MITIFTTIQCQSNATSSNSNWMCVSTSQNLRTTIRLKLWLNDTLPMELSAEHWYEPVSSSDMGSNWSWAKFRSTIEVSLSMLSTSISLPLTSQVMLGAGPPVNVQDIVYCSPAWIIGRTSDIGPDKISAGPTWRQNANQSFASRFPFLTSRVLTLCWSIYTTHVLFNKLMLHYMYIYRQTDRQTDR